MTKCNKNLLDSVLVVFLIAGLMISHSSHAFAQENRLTKEELESRLLSIKNPFESQLPKKEQKPEIVIKDPKPPILPVRNPEPPKQIKQPPDPDPPRPKIQETIKKIVPKPEIPVPSVAITGIIWNSDRPQAIINGQIVDIGDTILDLEITDIQKSGIEAMFHGRSVTIKTQRSPL